MKTLLKPKTYINSCGIVEFILPTKYSFVCLNHCVLTKAMRKYHMDKNVKVKSPFSVVVAMAISFPS